LLQECYKDTHMKAYDKYSKCVEYWHYIEMWVTSRSRSLKIVAIDNHIGLTGCWSATVTIALSCSAVNMSNGRPYQVLHDNNCLLYYSQILLTHLLLSSHSRSRTFALLQLQHKCCSPNAAGSQQN